MHFVWCLLREATIPYASLSCIALSKRMVVDMLTALQADFALVAFGGAGPMCANGVGKLLGTLSR